MQYPIYNVKYQFNYHLITSCTFCNFHLNYPIRQARIVKTDFISLSKKTKLSSPKMSTTSNTYLLCFRRRRTQSCSDSRCTRWRNKSRVWRCNCRSKPTMQQCGRIERKNLLTDVNPFMTSCRKPKHHLLTILRPAIKHSSHSNGRIHSRTLLSLLLLQDRYIQQLT